MFGCIPVAAEEIENAAMKIVFAGHEEGFAVRGVVNKKTGGTRYVNSIGGHADFWLLKFRAAADGSEVLLNNRMSAREKKVDRLPFGLRFSWLGCVLPKEGGTFDVFCDVSLPPGDAESEWRIRVENHSRAYALVATRYPHLLEVAPPGKCDLLRWQSQTGAKIDHAYDSAKGMTGRLHYPGSYHLGVAYLMDGGGLYVYPRNACGTAYNGWILPNMGFDYETFVENAGVVGKAGPGPDFAVAIACFKGDAWQAARIYRRWAEGQRWLAKGKIASRADFPKAAAERQIWLNAGGSAVVMSNVVQAVKRVWPGLDVGVEWSNWYLQPANFANPELFPPRPGMAETIAWAQAQGVAIMPYINTRLWDTNNIGFRYAQQDACLQDDGNYFVEKYYAGRAYAVMCPASKGWNDIVYELARRMLGDYGADAVYCDQLTCGEALRCRSPAHGHALSGGSWWVDSYRRALTRLRDDFPGRTITSEYFCEQYMDLIDGFLLWAPPITPGQFPFWQAAYSGYGFFYGYPGDCQEAPEEYFAHMAQTVLWGVAPGWVNPQIVLNPQYAAHARVLGRFAHLRKAAKEFLVYGTLEDELRAVEKAPDVLGNLWSTADGSAAAYVIANLSGEPRTVRFKMPNGMVGSLQTIPGETPAQLSTGDGLALLELGPRALAVVRLARERL